MTRQLRSAAGVLIVALSACSSAPTRYYTLTAVAPAVDVALPVSIVVGPLTLPAAVNTARIVLNVGANEVRPDEFNRWAAPLQEGIAQALAGDLSRTLGTERVTLATDALGATADYRVSIDVQRFDSVLDDAATLEAIWTVRRQADGHLEQGRTTRRESATGGGIGGLASAHSRALAQLGADIAAAIRSSYQAAR